LKLERKDTLPPQIKKSLNEGWLGTFSSFS